GIAFLLNYRVIRYAGATTSASVTYLLPVVATAIGVLGLGERLSWYQPVGALIVLCGVAVAQGMLRRPGRPARRGSVTVQEVAVSGAAARDVAARDVAVQEVAAREVAVQEVAARELRS
ncbi:MAG: DMT family transporter, partial [Micromonosporaceae bacterium]|nr:DMT family transporter [Micromonosporaceae bacterium]